MRMMLFACAESAAIDQATNRLSMFHLLEEILSPVFPSVFPQITVVALSSREEAEPSIFTLGLRITLSGHDQPLVHGSLFVDFQGRPRARTLGVVSGLLVPGPGNLRFSLSEGENELSAWDVIVRQIGEPTIVTQPAGPGGHA
jgi:hypothetical protein